MEVAFERVASIAAIGNSHKNPIMKVLQPLAWCVVGVGCFLLFGFASKEEVYRKAAPRSVTIRGFVDKYTDISKARTRVSAERRYLIIYRMPVHTNLLTLPSGPAAYVFDEGGLLVDWSPDIEHEHEFLARWGGPWEEGELAMEELQRIAMGSAAVQ